jgi:hypothetical protein
MAVGPGELPSFDLDFGPQQEYDPAKIAAEVIWPLVDAVWWNDWRKFSHVGNEWHVTKRGLNHLGELIDVTLNAFQDACILDIDEEIDDNDPDGPTMATAILELEPILTDHRRDIVLAHAAADNDEIADAVERYNSGEERSHEDEDEDEDEEGEPRLYVEDLTVKLNFSYKFYSDGEFAIESGKVVEDIEAFAIWTKDEDDDLVIMEKPEAVNEDDPETIILGQIVTPRIFDHDMEILESGLMIFNSPAFIIEAFKRIRNFSTHP